MDGRRKVEDLDEELIKKINLDEEPILCPLLDEELENSSSNSSTDSSSSHKPGEDRSMLNGFKFIFIFFLSQKWLNTENFQVLPPTEKINKNVLVIIIRFRQTGCFLKTS